MCVVARPKWGGELPFTILSSTNAVPFFYKNPDPSAYWHKVRMQSQYWSQSHERLTSLFQPKNGAGSWLDLDEKVFNTCTAP